jgi:hypothetical protein
VRRRRRVVCATRAAAGPGGGDVSCMSISVMLGDASVLVKQA